MKKKATLEREKEEAQEAIIAEARAVVQSMDFLKQALQQYDEAEAALQAVDKQHEQGLAGGNGRGDKKRSKGADEEALEVESAA